MFSSRLVLLAALAAATPSHVLNGADLRLEGTPFPGGNVQMFVGPFTSQNKRPLLLWSMTPLAPPIDTPFGPGYVGGNPMAFLLPTVPPFDAPVMSYSLPTVPPSMFGVVTVAQALYLGELSNPMSFTWSAPVLPTQTAIPHPAPITGTNFGSYVAAGDVNGDGFVDIAACAVETVNGLFAAGRVYLLFGPTHSTSLVIQSPTPKSFGHFGRGAMIVDLNQDGFDELVVGEGTPEITTPTDRAHVYVYAGHPIFSPVPAVTLASPNQGEEAGVFGSRVVAADLDGDGVLDLAVANSNATVNGMTRAGAVAVFDGPTFSNMRTVTSPTPGEDEFFGTSIDAGDLDQDGTADLVEGSGRANVQGIVNAGSIHVFRGTTTGLVHWRTIEPTEPQALARFGDPVHVRDLDNDGRGDIVTAEKGALFHMESPSFEVTALPRPPSQATSAFGYPIRSGDFNGDGFIDLAIGDWWSGPPGPGVGPGTLFIADGPYFATWQPIRNPSAMNADRFTSDLTVIDLTGDGDLEIIAGTPGQTIGASPSAGAVIIVD